MNADDILLDVEERMEKAIDVLKHALAGIRTGRANPGLVDSLRVDAYGSPTPIKQLASIGIPPDQPSQIVIRPFDPTTLKDIEKAIQASGLGFNPFSVIAVTHILHCKRSKLAFWFWARGRRGFIDGSGTFSWC